MGSISSPDSDPSPRRSAAGTQAESSEGKKSPVQGANPQSSINQGESPGVEAGSVATRAESAADLESAGGQGPDEGGCLKVELDLPADVLAAFDETAAEMDEDDPGAARELIAVEAITGHLAELGYEFEEAEDEDCEEEEAEGSDEVEPKGRYRVLEEVTLDPEILFDIGTEVDSLRSLVEMLDPVMGLLDTAEGMAYREDDNGRCGLDCLGNWTQKLFGVDLQEEMPEGSGRDSEDVYREAMLIPEMVRAAVRHRLRRLSVFVGMIQGYEAQ